jgi:hypothetical protein
MARNLRAEQKDNVSNEDEDIEDDFEEDIEDDLEDIEDDLEEDIKVNNKTPFNFSIVDD